MNERLRPTEVLDAFPVLASGKADRARLPAPVSPRLGSVSGSPAGDAPATDLERRLAGVWARVLGLPGVGASDDFFIDLGGHSLAAALVVSELRQDPAMRGMGVGDLYARPTVRGLAAGIEGKAATGPSASPTRAPRPRHGDARVLACGLAQAGLLYLAFLALGLPAVLLRHSGTWPAGRWAAALALAFGLAGVTGLALPIVAKWVLVGRFRPGRYPLWGWYYCRWWLYRKLLLLAPLEHLAGSPWMAVYARCLGAKVGTGCHLGTSKLQLPDLIEIGAGASVGYGVDLEPFVVEDGWLVLAPLTIGAGAFVGANAVVMPGARVGPGARVTEQTLVARGQEVPAGETWAGSPSRRVETDPGLDALEALEGGAARWGSGLTAGFALGFLALEALPLSLMAPGLGLLATAAAVGGWAWALATTPAAALAHVLTTCLVVAAGKRVAMPPALERAGVHPLHSPFGLRKWFSDAMMRASLSATNPLYATLFTSPWLRLLGARVGARAEVSTVSNIDPGLLTIGPESFVADLAVVGPARFHRGHVVLGETVLGARSFVGNAALIPSQARLPDRTLIGVQSVPPVDPADLAEGSSWLGSPSIYLPRRQASAAFDESLTYRPPARRVAARLAVESLRVTLPPTLTYVAVLVGALAFGRLARLAPWALPAPLPAVYLGTAFGLTLVVATVKWAVMGRYRPRVEPMWPFFVWRSELVTALYENVATPHLLRWLSGTPWMGPALRLFGARIGRRVYLETTFLTEFDLVRVGDDAMIAGVTSLQTHLFEDRVMKVSEVRIGPGCSVGPLGATAWLLYRFNGEWTGVARAGVFRDVGGFRTGYNDLYGEATLGLIWKPVPWLWVRPEVRTDGARRAPAFDDGRSFRQFTYGFDVLFLF